MTSTPFQSAALGGIIAPWAAKIAEFFGIIVEIILANAENVRTTLHELGAYCRKAAPGTAAGGVLPDDGEAPGWRATGRATCCLWRARSVRLPASLGRIQAGCHDESARQERSPFAAPSAPEPNDAARRVLLAEIGGGAGADLSPRKELRRLGADL